VVSSSSIFFYLFSLPNLCLRTLDVCHTSTHGVDAKNRQKLATCAPSHNFVGLYLRNYVTYRQSEIKFVKQQYLPHMFSQYGELRPTSGSLVWDIPAKFQRASRLGSVTARHSSSGRQLNCGVEQRAPLTFGWAAITLGIATHSCSFYLLSILFS